ncbi:MAG TPA: glycosyltransferase family 9 protein, partial [Candidatus Nitrosotenuis sp.]|nr:glycosyltransferase family 9 protein [Candidatus Nitrosotenuis sp.]
ADRSWAEPLALSQGLTPCCLPELGRWAAVLGQCRALITPDTGAVHVAAAMGVPVVDLFPQRHARHCVRRWRPFGVAHRVVLRGDYRPGAEKELARTLARAALDLARAADEGTPSCSS